MTGVLINVIAVIIGSSLGLILRERIPYRVALASQTALGFCIIVIGFKMAMQSQNPVLFLVCLALGGAAGAALQIDNNLEKFGTWLQKRLSTKKESTFVQGFLTASILYCTGAMAIVGSIEAGAHNVNDILIAKSMLDGIISISLATLYGSGVMFSSLTILIYQGAIALAAARLFGISEPVVLNEISGVGGVLVLMLGISMARLRRIPVADYLPAIVFIVILAPLAKLLLK